MTPITDIRQDLPRHETLRYPYRNPEGITHVMIHHSATFGRSAAHHARSHVLSDATRNKGPWPGLAYDEYITESGEAQLCKDIDEKGYHCGGGAMNSKAYAICLEGNFDQRPPTPEQIDAVVGRVIAVNYELGRRLIFEWHNNFRPTSCPGKHFPKAEVMRRVNAYYEVTPPEPDPVLPDPDEPDPGRQPDTPAPPPTRPDPDPPPKPVPTPGSCAPVLAILTILFTYLILS